MQMADLFPPGRVLWAIHNKDLHPSHQIPSPEGRREDFLRLFEVKDVKTVFGQMIFSGDMLRYATQIRK